MSNRNHRRASLALPSLALPSLALLAACSGDVVNLGENASELAAPDSACQGSTRVSGSVFVQNQAELERLTGCEVIEGDLFIYPFESPNFQALGALRVVEGELEVGRLRFTDPQITGASTQEDLVRDRDLQNSGWITSLAGFEALESVGALHLVGVGADSLEPLSQLRTLTQGGELEIGPCLNLRNLAGLENVTGLVDVRLNCDSLESIAGLALPNSLRGLFIEGSGITDLGAFDVSGIDQLSIVRTGLRNLDGLSSLVGVQRLAITNNPALSDAEGIGGFRVLNELFVIGNDALERLPDFDTVDLFETLHIEDNASLLALPSFPSVFALFEREAEIDVPLPSSPLNLAADSIVVLENPSLEEVTLTRGFPAVRYVEIGENARLSRIDLADVRAMDFLLIRENPALEAVDLGSLDTVDDLRVLGNPALPLEGFEAVRTFASQLSAELPADEARP